MLNGRVNGNPGIDPRIFYSYIYLVEKKRGRPKKPKAERRTKPLRVLLNPGERKAIDAAAGSQGMEPSTWARMELLRRAREINEEKRPPGD